MPHFNPLLAAGWGELVVVLIFFMISALGQLLSAKNKPARPRPPRPQGGDAPNKGQELADKLRGEVDDFLREMQGKPPKRKKPPKKPEPVIVTVEKTAPVVKSSDLRRESVQEHVSRHISAVEIARHTSKLGEEVGLADERLESHLQEKFAHKLGSLEHREQSTAAKAPAIRPSAIAELLRSPAGMRQAIIASEILRRPEI